MYWNDWIIWVYDGLAQVKSKKDCKTVFIIHLVFFQKKKPNIL